MSEIPLELVIGLIFVLVVLLVPYMPKKKFILNFKKPEIGFSKKKREEKLKEIDEKLEEVLSNKIGNEKVVKLEEATEEVAKNFEVKGDLLSEMQISNSLTELNESPPELKPQELSLPTLESFEDPGEVEKDVKLENEQKGGGKPEFDESDKLLEDIAKEVERKEEEELDLLRELKGQKFQLDELEAELKEIIERAKRLKA